MNAISHATNHLVYKVYRLRHNAVLSALLRCVAFVTRHEIIFDRKNFSFPRQKMLRYRGDSYFHFWFHVPLEHKEQESRCICPGTRTEVCTATRCTLSNFIFCAYGAASELWTITRHRVDILESGLSFRKLLTRELAVVPRENYPLQSIRRVGNTK